MQYTGWMLDPSWTNKFVELREQKRYLEEFLSKKVTTLNTLRDKETRNERALSLNPTPRSKRKKIQQNNFRTRKTIKQCESEERAALDCLRVCYQNISILALLLNPTEASSTYTAGELSCSASRSCLETESSATDVDWNGWTEDGEISPFLRKPQRFAMMDEIAPETPVDEQRPMLRISTANKPPARLSRVDAPVPSPPPPNTARGTQFFSSLSPMAKSFQPGSVCETLEECF